VGRLRDLSIVIIGGTGGLGLSAARLCLREGSRLTIVGRATDDLEQVARELGLTSGVLAGDATDPVVAERAILHAVSAFGRLDAVFHVAGGSGRRFGDGPLDQIPDEGWEYTVNANLTSLFYTNRAAARHFLQARHGGAVLNMSSVLGFSPAPSHFATHAYAAAKAGVIGLTMSCASYYARHNIRFNVIAPALVNTPAAARAAIDPQIVEYIRHKQPLDGGRVGRPEDLDGAILYFLSPESRFVTGQVLSVDGGWGVSEPSYGGPPAERPTRR
jgi:NAD(P)-dependent dehydrogenase (short-subunit alcohol dehydrogenase family)